MKPFHYALVIVAALLASAASSRTSAPSLNPAADAFHATDGAYRDGLFIGHLDRSHQRHHLASGRWNNAADRQSFVAGYEQGYSQAVQN